MNSGNYAYQCHEQKEAGNLAAAMVSCNKAIEMDPKNDAAYYYRGNVHAARGDFDSAIADYDVAINLDPKNENAYYYRGLARINKGDFDNAIADYTRYIEFDPKLAEAYHNRALARSSNGDYDNAIIDYNKAIELDPQLAEAYLGRAGAKEGKGDVDGAIADASKAIEIDRDNVPAYVRRGEIKAHKGDRTGSISDYSEALKIDPKSSLAYAARGYLLYDSQAWREALADFRASIANGSNNEDYEHLRIFLVRKRLGEGVAGIKELEGYLASRKNNTDWFAAIVNFLVGRTSEDRFLTIAGRGEGRKIQEQRCEAYFYAGTLRLIKGEKATALEYFRKSVETNVKAFTEYQSAKAELQLLNKRP